MVSMHRSFLGRNLGVVVLHLGLITASIIELGLSLSLPAACIFGRTSSNDLMGREGVCDLSKAMGFISLLFVCVILFFAWWSAQNQYYKLSLSFYRWASVAAFIGVILWLLTSIIVTVYLHGTCVNNGACLSLDSYSLGAWVVVGCWVSMVLWFMLLCRYLYLMHRVSKNLDYDEDDAIIEEEIRKEEELRRRRALEKETAELRRQRELEEQARLDREREEQLLMEMRMQRERDEWERRRPLAMSPVVIERSVDRDDEFRRAASSAESERLRRELELQRATLEREAAERAARMAEEDRARARALAEDERLRNLKWEEDRLRREREDRERAARLADEDRQRVARWEAEDKLRRDRAAEAQREADRLMARAREEGDRSRQLEKDALQRSAREQDLLEAERTRLALQAEAERLQLHAEADALRRQAEQSRLEEQARIRAEREKLHAESEWQRRQQEEEAKMRAAQQNLAAEAERQRKEAARLADMGRMEEAMRAEAARSAATAEANRLAQEELLAEEKRTRQEEEDRERARQAKRAGGNVVPKVVNVPRMAYNTLQQAKPRIETETSTQLKLQNTDTISNCIVSGPAQSNIDDASRKIENLINEEIRRDFGQTFQHGDAEPEYMSWLTGKRTNMVVALSKIYDKYPQVLAIKRTFDSVDNHLGISRGYLDKMQFISSFETLFPNCKKGMGPEYASYMYNNLDEDGDGSITWKEFIFYCLSNRLIVLKNEQKR